MASFTVRTGFQHVFQQVSYGSASITPAAATTGTTVTATVACGNAQIGDIVDVSAPSSVLGLIVQGEVLAVGVVTIKFANVSAGTVTPPAGIYKVVSYSLGQDFTG